MIRAPLLTGISFMIISGLPDAVDALPSSDQPLEETARGFPASPVVGLIGAEDEVRLARVMAT